MDAIVLVGGVDGAALLAGADLLVAVSDTGIAFAAGRGSPVTAARLPSPDAAGASSGRPEALTLVHKVDLLSVFSTEMMNSGGTTSIVMMPPVRFLKKIKPLSTASLNAIVS